MMLWRTAIIEGPTETNVSEQISLELNTWKEFSNITRSLNREASFPRGSFFFLDQSVGVCGAKIKKKEAVMFIPVSNERALQQHTSELSACMRNRTLIPKLHLQRSSLKPDLTEDRHF